MNAENETPLLIDLPEVAIRARPPSPRRLSARVLLAGTLAAGAVLAIALVHGLGERRDRRAISQDSTASAGGPPETIQGANAQYGAEDLPGGEADFPSPAPERPQLEPPRDAFWANTPPPQTNVPSMATSQPDARSVARAAPIMFGGPVQARDDRQRARPPLSRYEIQAGQVIPAALITALNSDLAGPVIAQVTAAVFDSVTGTHVLIPQGSRLIGAYANSARYGDRRVLLTWTRLIFPNGWSIDLEDMPAADSAGASGVSDSVDNHLDRLTAAIGLSAIISVIANEAEDEQESSSLAPSVGDAAAQQAAQTGGRIVDRDLSVRPTLRVRAGAPVRVLVARSIQIPPDAVGVGR